MKHQKTFKFWTEEEDKAIRTCISKFDNLGEACKWLAPKLDRTEKAIYVRMCNMKLNAGKFVAYKKSKRAKTESQGIAIPKGFTFDFTPTRAVIYSNHVRLYW